MSLLLYRLALSGKGTKIPLLLGWIIIILGVGVILCATYMSRSNPLDDSAPDEPRTERTGGVNESSNAERR